VNVVADSDTQIFMISSKHRQIITHYPESARIDLAVLPQLLGRTASLTTHGDVYSARHDKALSYTIIAFRTKQSLLAYWMESFWLWLPAALLFSLFVGYAVFKQMEARYALSQKLSRAIKRRELSVHYQPIISLHSGKCIGAETLIRWKGSNGKMIPPEQFIPMAEETGLIEPLTDLIMDNAINELESHLLSEDFYISINLSASDMAKPRFFELLQSRLAAHGIKPAKVVIEATESGFYDVAQANTVMQKFHDSGHTVFIDDFGTGYSSLSTLQNLAIDCIKIDKSFVDAINTESATSSVILHIIAMAKQLNLKTVAEGVETQSQADFLRQHGVDSVQGFYFAHPMPAAAFLDYIAQNREVADL
jgi:sensor c-di-GMP phosphodiesterase-like protein